MTPKRTAFFLAATALLFCAAAVYPAEYFDHPQIGRYEGSNVIHQEASGFDRYTLGLGPAVDGKLVRTTQAEGKVLMTLYGGPKDASSFEIFSAYRKLLQSKGFEVLFTCEKSGCGDKFLEAFYALAPFANDPGWNNSAPITHGNADFSYILIAKSGSPGSEIYVSLIVSQGWWSFPVYKLDVLEAKGQAGKISSVAGSGEKPVGAAPGAAPSGKALDRPLRFGVQMSSDSFLGLILCENRYEFAVKAQAILYDGFQDNKKPDNDSIRVGAHAAFLFRPSDLLDISVGAEAQHAIKLNGDYDYIYNLRAGLRIGLNYHISERFMVSGVVHPFWVETTETSVSDSYQLIATLPTASVSFSFFF